MDIKYLELIENLNQTHSLTLSAQKLGYTQSALSHSIKKIEEKLGVTLLSRTNHGVALTTEAKFLLPYIQSTTKQYHAFEEAVSALHGLKKAPLPLGLIQAWLFIGCHKSSQNFVRIILKFKFMFEKAMRIKY